MDAEIRDKQHRDKPEWDMTIEALRAMLDNETFHHATYRNIGKLWEGLHIYTKDEHGFRGFVHAGVFSVRTADLERAMEITARTGISVGSYGKG